MARHLIHSGAIGCLLLLQACDFVHGQELGTSRPSSQEAAELEFELNSGDPILVPVSVNGQAAIFILDTGSTHHLLDQRYEPQLGKPIFVRPAETAGSQITVKLFSPPEMTIGQVTVAHDRPVASLDFTPIAQAVGRDIQGLLAVSILRDQVLTLNADQGRIYFTESYIRRAETPVVAVPIQVNASGLPHVEASIGGSSLSFLLDTGMVGASVSLATPDFQRLREEGLIESVRATHAATAGGVGRGRLGRLKAFQLGPFTNGSLAVSESTSNKIGLRYLLRFHTTIDMPGRALHLQKIERFNAPDGVDRSGLTLLWVDENVTISSVDRHSPADEAGFVAGDILVQVNGEMASGATLSRIRRMFRGPAGSEMDTTVIRGGAMQRKHFRLLDYDHWYVCPSSTEGGNERR